MSDYITDTGRTRTEPIDYSWRNQPGAGCLGEIDCEKCGCIMSASGSHCFCMGIYTCPRCGHGSKGWVGKMYTIDVPMTYSDGIVDTKGMLVSQLKSLNEEDRREVFRSFCNVCNRFLEDDERCFCWNDE